MCLSKCEHIKSLEDQLACLQKKYREVTELLEEERNNENLTEDGSMYEHLLDQRRLLMERIEKVTASLKGLERTKDKEIGKRAEVGAYVEIQNTKSYHKVYLVKSSDEANPAKGYISISSPLGKAIYGKSIGDNVQIESPTGNIHYQIKVIK